MPHATDVPPGQTVVAPAAQLSKSQPGSPARPCGHSSRQREPLAQVAVQWWSRQAKRHSLFGPQVQLPFWHSPAHSGWSPSQRRWHGPEPHSNSQVAPRAHEQVPFSHAPRQVAPGSQLTWHGGLWQAKSHREFGPQVHEPSAHSPAQRSLSPAQSRWQGGAAQGTAQRSPLAQKHAPFAQAK